MASLELPEEIVAAILARLPVETLIRFSSASKSWHALIRSPSFIDHHLKQSLSTINSSSCSNFLALLYNNRLSISSFLVTLDKARCCFTFEQSYLPDQEHGCDWMGSALLGCACGCCGVYIVSKRFEDRAVIWNPATRETRTVPFCPVTVCVKYINYKFLAFSCSMSMDHQNNKKVRDFKFMRLLCPPRAAPVLQVYTMSRNSWTTTIFSGELIKNAANVSQLQVGHPWGVVNLHNNAHWLVKFRETELIAILFFNFEKENFGLFPVPGELKSSGLHRVFLTLFDSKFLCLIKRRKTRERRKFETWVMREYGDKEEQCNWVRHSVVRAGKSLTRNVLAHMWSPVDEDDEGITGLYSHGKTVYFCSKLGFQKIKTLNGHTVLISIVKNVNSLVSLQPCVE